MSTDGGGGATGLTFGAVLAAILSWTTWHSLGWVIVHAFFGWFYVIYWALTVGTRR